MTIARLFILAAQAFAIAVASVAHAETRRYDWLTIGEKSGELIVEDGENGELSLTFSFNDRGRGPELSVDYRLDDAGVPISMTVEGVNYYKGDAAETFIVEDGKARWTTSAGSGEKRWKEPALYSAKQETPEHLAILARALLNDPDQKMPTLPEGELRLEEIETAIFEGLNGGVDATLYGLYGASPYPQYIWLDDDKNLFGADYAWFAIAPEGMASAMPLMKERQDAATNEITAALSAAFRHDASGQVVIRGARLFDSLTGEVAETSTVFIQDGVIAAVYKEDVAPADGSMVINAKGKTLLPALWDMHAHIGTENLFNYVSAGVLNIRDMANDPEYILSLKTDIASGAFAAPDVYAMGFIDKRSEYAAPTGMLADTLDEALAFVDWYAQRGFRGIKLYSSIEPDWVEAIAEKAHARGMMVLGHIPAHMTAEQAIRAGYDEVTHINMLFLNFMGTDIDTRTPQRFIVPITEGGNLDLDSDAFNAFLALMKERGVAHDPTHTLFQGNFSDEAGKVKTQAVRFMKHLPKSDRAGLIATPSFNAGLEAEGRRSAEVARDMIKKLHENGVPVFPGTDTAYPGFVLLREMELFAEAGIPPNEVLQLATIAPARHLGVDQTTGSISVGKKAHLILVDGDPAAKLADLYKVETVIKGTSLYRPDEIHEAFGIKPFR